MMYSTKTRYNKGMVTTCGLLANQIGNRKLLTTYLFKVQCVYITCYLSAFPDFSNQIVIHDNPSLHVQGIYILCECSALQTRLWDDQLTQYHLAGYCQVRKQKPNLGQNILTTFKSAMSYGIENDWSVSNVNLIIDNPHAAFIHGWSLISLLWDLISLVIFLNIVYFRPLNSRERSWMWKTEVVGLD
jgi:hypothetical protein